MWLRGIGELGNVPGALGIFSFNSIKGNGKWMGNELEMEMLYIFYMSCLVVNFLFFKGQNTGE